MNLGGETGGGRVSDIYNYESKHDCDGRIVENLEKVKGESYKWTYKYDKEGRLGEAILNGRRVCKCEYDLEGRRIQDVFPLTCGTWIRNFEYRMDNRLSRAGDNGYTHDKNGFRSIWNNRGKYTTYKYASDYRLLEAHLEDDDTRYTFDHDDNGQRMAKYRNGSIVEAYRWLDLIRLRAFHDGAHGYRFVYEDETRMPYAMEREGGVDFFLYYDQIGSLRVVADVSGNVIKEVLYEPFGGIIEDSNPDFRVPIGFAGGLHDRDLGFVRFGWRDYDTLTGRWTAPDPMGDAGGNPDWYGYCLDDPVNMVDPLGLMGSQPEPPSPESSFQDVWQWQTSEGACKKCSARDGTLYFGSEPEFKPVHPNCKCEIVPCHYMYEYGDWVQVECSVYDRVVSIVWAGATGTAYWKRTITINEEREIEVYRECGSDSEHVHDRAEKNTRTEVEADTSFIFRVFQGRKPDTGDGAFTTNPWTGDTVLVDR